MIRLQFVAIMIATLLSIACGEAVQPHNSSPSQSPSGNSGIPANAKVIRDIQRLPDWTSCSANCAGQSGTDAVYSMEQGVASPSLSGSAIKFNIDGGTPWGAALWWKQVGGNDAMTHFLYELSFYMKDPGAAQALEFNVNQNAGGWRYEYATQCDIRGAGVWRIWDRLAGKWIGTSVPCEAPTANAWNKLVWEFERTSDHKVVFAAVTLNGKRSAVNRSVDAYEASGSGIDVAFQMDANGVPTPFSVWVDNISLSEW